MNDSPAQGRRTTEEKEKGARTFIRVPNDIEAMAIMEREGRFQTTGCYEKAVQDRLKAEMESCQTAHVAGGLGGKETGNRAGGE